ncbi:hypothetical protein CSUI_008868, partial [Cystoisospora suis]
MHVSTYDCLSVCIWLRIGIYMYLP